MPLSRDLFAGSYDGDGRSGLRARRVWAVLVLVVGLILALFFGGEYIQRYRAYTAARKAPGTKQAASARVRLIEPARPMARNTLFSLPRPWWDSKLVASGLPVYDLRISATDLRRLHRFAEGVTARGFSTELAREQVSGEFLMDGAWVQVQVRLRGLLPRHYLVTRPSWRLQFPANRPLAGKRQINLLDPYDKQLAGDATVLWELQRRGVLAWDNRWVVVRLNGKVLGVYQEIEHFGRSLLDRQGRSEGHIFSGSGQLFGKEQGSGYAQAAAAIRMAQDCWDRPRGPLPPGCGWERFDEYFDSDRWAWAGAMVAVLGSRHGWGSDNLRLYWDPALGKFEPIPWDYLCLEGEEDCLPIDPARYPEGETLIEGYGPMVCSIPEYRRMRDQRIWTLITERVGPFIEHADSLFEQLVAPLSYDLLNSTQTDRHRHGTYVDAIRENSELFKRLFGRHDLRGVVWRPAGAEHAVIELRNHGKSFLAVEAAQLVEGGRTFYSPLADPALVDGVWYGEAGAREISLALSPEAKLVGLTVRDRVTGTLLTDAEISLTQGSGSPPPLSRQTAPAPRGSELRIEARNVRVQPGRVTFGPGRVDLQATLEIPASHALVFAPGLDLRMGRGVSLHIYGDVSSIGSAAAPIKISGAKRDEPWGGVLIQGSRTRPSSVRMEHTSIDGGTGGATRRTPFTGSLSVHGGKVFMRACQFRHGAEDDDAVNLKYCEVELRDNLFEGARMDALDLDFCEGSVVSNTFRASGGDAVDTSGSEVSIQGLVVEGCGDKGLSLGENSRVTVADARITGCRTGIAVKDLSDATIRDSSLGRLQVGVSLYIKKLTFGPSRARLVNVSMRDVEAEVIRQEGCTVERR